VTPGLLFQKSCPDPLASDPESRHEHNDEVRIILGVQEPQGTNVRKQLYT
jgi:hypothetical protein